MIKKIVCPECDGRGYISHVETWEYEDGLGGGQAWSEKCAYCNGTGEIEVPMTNYDFIKKMDIKELATFFAKNCDCSRCPAESQCLAASEDMDCWDVFMCWLNNECEG